jgi:hypothetical protein
MAGDEIRELLAELDRALVARVPEGTRLDLFLLGRSALILRYGATAATKDLDVLDQTNDSELLAQLLTDFGRHSPAAERIGVYLERVPHALPPVPGRYRGRCTNVPVDWRVIRPQFLEANDYAVTKLRRFSPKDREDIAFLCDRRLVTPAELRASFESAFAWYYKDDQFCGPAEENLNRVLSYLDGRTPTL